MRHPHRQTTNNERARNPREDQEVLSREHESTRGLSFKFRWHDNKSAAVGSPPLPGEDSPWLGGGDGTPVDAPHTKAQQVWSPALVDNMLRDKRRTTAVKGGTFNKVENVYAVKPMQGDGVSHPSDIPRCTDEDVYVKKYKLALLNGLHKQSPMKGLPGKQSSMSLGLQVLFLVSYCWNLLRIQRERKEGKKDDGGHKSIEIEQRCKKNLQHGTRVV
ncbi:hypothetical protein PAMA_011786 [Pampus argenteus]